MSECDDVVDLLEVLLLLCFDCLDVYVHQAVLQLLIYLHLPPRSPLFSPTLVTHSENNLLSISKLNNLSYTVQP